MTTQTQEGKLLQVYLMASYAYYVRNTNIILDTTYDHIAKTLEARWDCFDHPHKYLVDRDDLSATTLYKLSKASDYPLIVAHAAEKWIEAVETGKRVVK